MNRKILIESLEWVPFLYEGKSGTTNIRFKFAESDKVNLNKRRYPHAVLSNSIAVAQRKIDEGITLYGSTSHILPEMNVDDVSHRLLKVSMHDHDAVAEAAILATSKGTNLQAILAGGGVVGCSMRGTGTTQPMADGIMEVQSDHVILGIDVVLNPSFGTNISAKNIFESADFSGGEPEVGPNVLMKRYREARLAGFTGSLEQLEENINKINQNDEGLMREFLEARSSGFVGTYDQYWEQWMARHGGCDE
jgi:hypothetical protein